MRYFLFAILFIFGRKCFTQFTEKHISLSVGMSGNTYQGDFTRQHTISTLIYPGFSIGAQFYKKYTWVKSLQFGYGAVAGQIDRQNAFQANAAGLQINSYFYTPYFHAGFHLKKVFLPHSPFPFYLETGIGGLRYSPTATNGYPLAANTDSRLEGETYTPFTYYIPASLGCICRIKGATSLQIAYNFFYTGSDYLDNVGKVGKVKGNDAIQNLEVTAIFPIIVPQKISPDNLVISSPTPMNPTKTPKNKSLTKTKQTKDSLEVTQNNVSDSELVISSPKPAKTPKNKSPQKAKQAKDNLVIAQNQKDDTAALALSSTEKTPLHVILKEDSLASWETNQWSEELTTLPPSPIDTIFMEQEITWEEDTFLLAEDSMLSDSMQTIYEQIKAQTKKAIQQGYFLYHQVIKNETIFSLSLRFQVTKDSIIALNQVKNTLILEGEVLKIPDVSKILDKD